MGGGLEKREGDGEYKGVERGKEEVGRGRERREKVESRKRKGGNTLYKYYLPYLPKSHLLPAYPLLNSHTPPLMKPPREPSAKFPFPANHTPISLIQSEILDWFFF